MNRLMRMMMPLALAGSLFLVAGCDEDEGGPTDATDVGNLRDITVTLQNMDSHLGQFMEFRILSQREAEGPGPFDWLRAVAWIDSLESATFTFTMVNAVPEGLARLDFWVDSYVNPYAVPYGGHWYDIPYQETGYSGTAAGPEYTDDAYRIMLPEDDGDIAVVFTHPEAEADTLYARFTAEPNDAMFLDVNQPTWQRAPLHLWMDFTGMTPHEGQLLGLKVIDPTTGVDRVVGMYLGRVPGDAFQIVLPNQGVQGSEYHIDFFADLNGNGTYDGTPTDHSWRVTKTIAASADTFDVDFTYSTNFTTIIWP
jgi:hypothetical protein